MRYHVQLKKIFAEHQRLRDDVIKGFADHVPTEGKPFVMFGEGRDVPDSIRMVSTSPVTHVANIEDDGEIVGFVFNTRSGSTYQLDLLMVSEVQ